MGEPALILAGDHGTPIRQRTQRPGATSDGGLFVDSHHGPMPWGGETRAEKVAE